MAATPRVSVGMPVYNGQDYLAAAIESILGQTFTDLELVICDNASTDATESICREFAAKDARVRYYRNPTNLGAAPNYRRAFELARGHYFKWAAHDDLHRPEFIAACVAALDANPDASLCMPGTVVIDEHGNERLHYESGLDAAGSADPVERFGALIVSRHWCCEIFALMPAAALRRAKPYRGYNASDRVLLAELALIGRFLSLPEPMFLNRDHPDRYSRLVYPDLRKSLSWNDTGRNKRFFMQTATVLGAYIEMVGRLGGDMPTKLRAYGQIGRWLLHHWNWLRLLLDPLRAVDPRIYALASRIKRRLFGGGRPAAYGNGEST